MEPMYSMHALSSMIWRQKVKCTSKRMPNSNWHAIWSSDPFLMKKGHRRIVLWRFLSVRDHNKVSQQLASGPILLYIPVKDFWTNLLLHAQCINSWTRKQVNTNEHIRWEMVIKVVVMGYMRIIYHNDSLLNHLGHPQWYKLYIS
jgi:hypothetical protein